MNMSRFISLIKQTRVVQKGLLCSKNQYVSTIKQQVRHSSHGGRLCYREVPDAAPESQRRALVLGTIIWWWVFWHCITEYEELIGPIFPDPSEFTDEELGIPPI